MVMVLTRLRTCSSWRGRSKVFQLVTQRPSGLCSHCPNQTCVTDTEPTTAHASHATVLVVVPLSPQRAVSTLVGRTTVTHQLAPPCAVLLRHRVLRLQRSMNITCNLAIVTLSLALHTPNHPIDVLSSSSFYRGPLNKAFSCTIFFHKYTTEKIPK